MALRFPFISIIPANNSPMLGLVKHYEFIEKGIELVEQAWIAYMEGDSKSFIALKDEVDIIEDKADTVKRGIRNHMPRSLFMPVDKTVFFNYTRAQDNILDAGQDCLNWLALRDLKLDAEICEGIKEYLKDVFISIALLRPALENTVEMLDGGTSDRDETKKMCREVALKHKQVNQEQRDIITSFYSSNREFKEVYQLLKAIEELHNMSHNAERCSDMLRAMIAK